MTQLRIVDRPTGRSGWEARTGDMWSCPQPEHVVEGRGICWVIRMPDRCAWWHTNRKCTSEPHKYWTVTGEAPNLTVTPSINIGPEWWHGHITDGVMLP